MAIAVDRLGVYRYSYGGKMRALGVSKNIDVCSVAADSVGHVIITDFQGDKIHMLNQDGNFLRYIIPHGMELNFPRALCVLDNDKIIVGECMSGLAKIIQFMKKQE